MDAAKAVVILIALAAPFAAAGFADLIISSPQSGAEFHQGDYITITVVLANTGMSDGGAAYLTEVRLVPNPCINHGVEISLPGAIICPPSSMDSGCSLRFRNATLTNTFTFSNISTSEGCGNGKYEFTVRVSGNNEVGQGGFFGPFLQSKEREFEYDFIGPLYCGDRICTEWKGEDCHTCSVDCERCPECTPGETACSRDSIAACDERGYWEEVGYCEAGCHLVNGTPTCKEPCIDGIKSCVAENILTVCVAKRWENRTCPYGCIFDSCKGACGELGCENRCMGSTLFSGGVCDNVTGMCSYSRNETCPDGCTQDGTACLTKGGLAAGFDIMLIAAAVLAIGAGVFAYFKFFRKKKAPLLDDIMPYEEPRQPPYASPPSEPPPASSEPPHEFKPLG